MFKRIKIRSYEIGLYFRDGEFKGLLGEGRHWLFDLFGKVRVDVVSQREVAKSTGRSAGAVYVARYRVIARLKEKVLEVSQLWDLQENKS